MTNEAMSAVLEYLCNEARNSMHATFGLMELVSDGTADPAHRASLAIGRASADQLLRAIDDVRELLSNAPPAPSTIETFDLTLCAGEIIEVLNLASGKRRRQIMFDAPSEPLLIVQDRKAVEQLLMRFLDTAFKLTPGADVFVRFGQDGLNGVRLAIETRDVDLAARLVTWLNSTLEQTGLEGPGDLPFGVAVMVAGKRLREMGGSAELIRNAGAHSALALDLPLRAHRTDEAELECVLRETVADALNILVAEDCDDSFFLTELLLQDERVQRARDGREALHTIQKQRFDVVLMDVHMPGMDGYSAIRNIRDWETQTGNARTPLVILSSDDLETQQRSAAESGCSGFLRKPLRRSDLTNLLDRLKQSRRLAA